MGSSGSVLADIQPPFAEAQENARALERPGGFGREVEFSLSDKAALEPEPEDSRSGWSNAPKINEPKS
jgi:hypothetical protein